MQRYRWPSYERQLLGELQRQQNSAQFCDTLLQTEDIAVPTHSCVLAALSPYLSQKLSVSPSPPPGQKLQIKLQPVKAQTLLKLVGLMYSGELQVKGSIEQNDVLSTARQFGIAYLVEGWKDGGMKEGEPQKKSFGSRKEKEEKGRESRKMQDAQVQADMVVRRVTYTPIEKRNCVSTGTQTVKGGEKTAASTFTQSSQTKPPIREPASSVAQSLDFSITLQPQNDTLENQLYSTCSPTIPSGASTNGESTIDRSSDSVANPRSTSAWSSDVMSFPIAHSDDSNSPTPHEDNCLQQSSEFGDGIGTGLEDKTTNAKTAEKSENTEQSSHANRDEILREERGNSTEKKQTRANVGMKRLAKMKQMQEIMETTQISIKVKLRRRTKGEVWEVVSLQDADETLSVLTSLKKDGPNNKRPQADHTNSELPPSSVQPSAIRKPETPILEPATTNYSEPPPHSNTTSDSQVLCSDCFTTNQNKYRESVPLPQPPGPVEESDEQIEKLLEDIMMGLNILPNLEMKENREMQSHHLHLSHDKAPAICQVPVPENDRAQGQMHAEVSAAGCVYYQDFGTQVSHSSAVTGQNQSGCSSLTSAQSDAVVIQQQQCSHSSVTSMGQRDGTGHQSMSLSQSQNCPYPETPITTSVIPSTLYSSGQKLHYPACQEPLSQDDQNILEFLPLTNGNEAQSSHSFSLPYMDDLRLPRCLSPLETFSSAAIHQSEPRVVTYRILNNLTTLQDKIQPQPSLHGRPWLAENPGSLQFPLSAITHRENTNVSLAQDTNHRCLTEPHQKHLELNPQYRGTGAESDHVKEVEEGGTKSAGYQNAAAVKSDHRKMKESLKCRQGDTKDDTAAPKRRKRKRTSLPQDAAGSLLSYKDLKISDGIKSRFNLSVCSVSLLSNNVLAKERQMATSSSNIPYKLVWKPDELSTITESWREKTRGAGDLKTDRSRIRTRGFVKKTQETPSNTCLENSLALKPMAKRAKIVNEQGVLPPKRKRGRPPKRKLEDGPLATAEIKIHSVESGQQIDNNLPKKEGEDTKTRFKKQRRIKSEVEVIPLKKTVSAESTGKAEADDNNNIIPKVRKLGAPNRPGMVTLKEFQKLIKHHHSKTRKSRESQEKEKAARDVESKEKACESRCEELIKETDTNIDMTQPQNRDPIEDSHINVTVDKNQISQNFNKSTTEQSKSQQDDTNGSSGEGTGLFGDENHQGDVLGDEVTKLTTEREQSLKSPEEARKACDAGVSDTTQQTAINDKGSSHCDNHTLPPEDKMPLDQTPERAGPPPLDAVKIICQEEEDEEVEVDVLHYSPDNVPQSTECENGLDNMELSPEEEEEEDMNEIDVTGDEAD